MTAPDDRNDDGTKIRYTREALLQLRDSVNLSKVNLAQVAPLAARMNLLYDGSKPERERERDTRRKEPSDNPASTSYSSTNALTSSPSTNLMPSFVNKRAMHGERIFQLECHHNYMVSLTKSLPIRYYLSACHTASTQPAANDVKRNSAIPPKKEDQSTSIGSNRRSISNSRSTSNIPSTNNINSNTNSTVNEPPNSRDDDPRSRDSGDRTNFMRRKQFQDGPFRPANENRRIGSGRIPMITINVDS